MRNYLHPGVYVEEIPSGSKPIEGVGTSTAAFVGYATKGPIGKPVLIKKWDEYEDTYGGVRNLAKNTQGDPMGLSVAAFFLNGGTKAYIVRVTEDTEKKVLGANRALKAEGYVDHPDETGKRALKFTAANEGAWANGIVVKIQVNELGGGSYDVLIGRESTDTRGNVTFTADESFVGVSLDVDHALYIENVINTKSELVMVDEVPDVTALNIVSDQYLGTSTSNDLTGVSLDFSALTVAARKMKITVDSEPEITIELDKTNFPDLASLAAHIRDKVQAKGPEEYYAKFSCEVLNNENLVLTSGTRKSISSVKVESNSGITQVLGFGTELTGQEHADSVAPRDRLDGGTDGGMPLRDDYIQVFTLFTKYRDINILCLPGQYWSQDSSGNAVVQAAISHAEKMKSRMVLVDPPPSHELTNEKMVNDMGLPSQTYCVTYYPWVSTANRFYHAERAPGLPKNVLVPPSGYAAGMWAKIDAKRGVWKAAAGTETGLLGLSALEFLVEDGDQDALNPWGVNCLRRMPGAGPVIWGARTLATKADPEWRYVPIRRTAIMIEQSIYQGVQWAVFEPNNHILWSSLRANIGNFMNGLFRAGAFQGEKASDAYFVRCGLGDTMTQGEIDAGQVITIVGFAPLKPAEFVIVRIQQKVNQQ